VRAYCCARRYIVEMKRSCLFASIPSSTRFLLACLCCC
jgi:hypothetical protein